MRTVKIIVASWAIVAILAFTTVEASAGIVGWYLGGLAGTAAGGVAWGGFGSPYGGWMDMGGMGGGGWRVLAQ